MHTEWLYVHGTGISYFTPLFVARVLAYGNQTFHHVRKRDGEHAIYIRRWATQNAGSFLSLSTRSHDGPTAAAADAAPRGRIRAASAHCFS